MCRILYVLVVVSTIGCREAAPIAQPVDEPSASAMQASAARYDLVRLPSLGGTDSRGIAINNRGWVAGVSNRGDGSMRAVLWRDGSVLSLGTLDGPASSVARAGLNDRGVIVGISHTDRVDPEQEQWSCEGTFALPTTDPRLICAGFVWEGGVMRELPALGGNHGFAGHINNRGQAIGWAETDVRDPTCAADSDQVLQFRGVVWDTRRGTAEELPPFPGDSASAATGINERGQIVGISGDCDQAIGRFSARRAVLWENGSVTEIPNLGGTTWHTPWAINERGDVVGFSNLPEPGDPGAFNAHAFLWRYGSAKAIDLGTLEGDRFSQGMAINPRGQVVGVSSGGDRGARAFIWEEETGMRSFSELVDLEPDEVVEIAHDLNAAGQVTGRILNHATNERTAFIATPRRGVRR